MKNIFGFNRSIHYETEVEVFDGARFITASVTEEKPAETENEKRATVTLPLPLTILQYVFVALFAIGLGIWVSSGMTLSLMIKQSLHVLIILAVGFVGFVTIAIVDVLISKKFAKENGLEKLSEVEEFVELHEVDEEAEAAQEARVKAELGIPDNAVDMDFFSFFYREGPEGIFAIKPFDYMTLEMFAYVEDGYLRIADYNDVYSVAISDMVSVERMDTEITVLGWSKDESFDSETYAEYGFYQNDAGFVVMPYYYVINVKVPAEEGEETDYALLIPPYEAKAFSELTGISFGE